MKVSIILGAISFASTILGASIKIRDDEQQEEEESNPFIAISHRVELEPKQFKELGAKRIKARYGPFLVPGIGDPETMGMKEFEAPVEMPCQDCFITSFVAGLEFADGSNANAATGMWLHHTVFFNTNQNDTSCPEFPTRFLASGNERTPLDLTNGGKYKAGLYISPDDQVVKVTELMNESALDREAYVTAEWEYIPADTPGFRAGKVIWLDVSGLCSNTSAVYVDEEEPVFSRAMEEPWTIDFDAEVLANLGHLHDGGVHQEVYINEKQVCDHVAVYGESEDFITHVGMYGHEKEAPEHEHEEGTPEHEHEEETPEHEHEEGTPEHEHEEGPPEHEHEEGHDDGEKMPPHMHDKRQHTHDEGEAHDEGEGHDEGEAHDEGEVHDHSTDEHFPHISSISSCTGIGTLKAGDKLSIKSYYDMNTHKGMPGHHGGMEPVMGITLLFVLPTTPEVDFKIDLDE